MQGGTHYLCACEGPARANKCHPPKTSTLRTGDNTSQRVTGSGSKPQNNQSKPGNDAPNHQPHARTPSRSPTSKARFLCNETSRSEIHHEHQSTSRGYRSSNIKLRCAMHHAAALEGSTFHMPPEAAQRDTFPEDYISRGPQTPHQRPHISCGVTFLRGLGRHVVGTDFVPKATWRCPAGVL